MRLLHVEARPNDIGHPPKPNSRVLFPLHHHTGGNVTVADFNPLQNPPPFFPSLPSLTPTDHALSCSAPRHW